MSALRGTLVLVVLLVSGCAAQVVAPPVPQVATEDLSTGSVEERPPVVPTGRTTVAYPDPVGTWWQESVEDLAAGDLAALWALPMHRTDPLGRQVPALAVASRVVPDAADWIVEVDLAPGSWSDGQPVTAEDVVATAGVLADARPAAWGAYLGGTAVDAATVRLRFDRPFAGWSALLSGAPGVLPAHVLAEEGLDAYAGAPPVTGGPFTVTAVEPGLRMVFGAHTGSPLGAPQLEEVELLVVPDHDVALGLLAADKVDALLGHVALDPSARRAAVPGLEGAAVFGGTRFELAWDPEATGADLRTRIAAGLDVVPFVEGLLRDVGRLPGGVLPAIEARAAVAAADPGDGVSVAVQVVRTVEGLGLLARRLQAELELAGVEAALVRLDPPQHLAEPVDVQARLRVVRVPPHRSLASLLAEVGLDPAPGLAADANGSGVVDPVGAPEPADGPVAEVQAAFAADPRVLPLAEVAVAHAWQPDRIAGIEPSGWPGLAFWNVAAWSVPTD